MKLKKTYSYALSSALYLTLLSVVIATLTYSFLFNSLGVGVIIVFAILLFFISFFVIQYRAENFIFNRVKKIYNEISILTEDDLTRNLVTTELVRMDPIFKWPDVYIPLDLELYAKEDKHYGWNVLTDEYVRAFERVVSVLSDDESGVSDSDDSDDDSDAQSGGG